MGNKHTKNNNTEQGNTESPYGMTVNGGILSAPSWPHGDSNMFLVSKKLNIGDQLNVSGTLAPNPGILTVSLVTDVNGSPDYQNTPCVLEMTFESNVNNSNEISVRSIQNGMQINIHNVINSTPNYISSPEFKVEFIVRDRNVLDILVNQADLDQVQIPQDVSEIRYIMVKGDVIKIHELGFKFA